MKASSRIVLLFAVMVVVIIAMQQRGPFFDEGIYTAAGLRNITGQGYSDGYLVWFSGSLLWPTLAGVFYQLGGLIAVRLLAAAFIVHAMLATVDVTNKMYGENAAKWSAISMMLFAPLWLIAPFGVNDITAIWGIAISVWAVSKAIQSNNRVWVGLSAILFMLGAFSKYPLAAMLFVPIALLFSHRRKTFLLDVGVFAFVAGIVFLIGYLPVREQMGEWFAWSVQNKPTFGVNTRMILHAQVLFLGIPLFVGLVGLAFSRSIAATAMVMAAVFWPIYHVVSGNPVSDWKHATLGFLLISPLIGYTLSRLNQKATGKVVVGIFVLVSIIHGLQIWKNLYFSWPDVRPGAEYLMENVQPGDQLMIDHSWPYTMYLIGAGNIESPWDVFDNYRISHGEAEHDLCNFDWFVVEKGGSYTWPIQIQSYMINCGFEPVFEFDSSITGLAPDLNYYTQQTTTIIYRRTKP